MTGNQKYTLTTFNEIQLQFLVEDEVVVINEIEAGEEWRIYIIHPNGTYKSILYKGRPDRADYLAISEADWSFARRNQMARKTREEIEEIEANLPETITCKYCQKEIKRTGFAAHERTKAHLRAFTAYKEAHPEEFKPGSSKTSGSKPKASQKPTSKSSGTKTKGSKIPRGAIGKYCLELLHNKALAGKTYEELAAMVREKFNSKTSKACIAWYVSQNKSDKTMVARSKPTKPKETKKPTKTKS